MKVHLRVKRFVMHNLRTRAVEASTNMTRCAEAPYLARTSTGDPARVTCSVCLQLLVMDVEDKLLE